MRAVSRPLRGPLIALLPLWLCQYAAPYWLSPHARRRMRRYKRAGGGTRPSAWSRVPPGCPRRDAPRGLCAAPCKRAACAQPGRIAGSSLPGCCCGSRQCRSAGRCVGAPVALNISLAPPNPGYRVRGDTIGGTNPRVRPDYCAKPGYLATTGSTPREPSARARRRPIRGGLRVAEKPPRRLTWGGVAQSMTIGVLGGGLLGRVHRLRSRCTSIKRAACPWPARRRARRAAGRPAAEAEFRRACASRGSRGTHRERRRQLALLIRSGLGVCRLYGAPPCGAALRLAARSIEPDGAARATRSTARV